MPQFGLVYRLTPAFSAYANFSKSFVPNVATEVSAPLAPERGRVFETGLRYDAHGSARSRGIELDVVGRLTQHVSVIGSYAYTNATDRDDGARLVCGRPGDTANSFTLPGYVVADVFAAYDTKFGKIPTHMQLNVKNVFDKTYYPSSNSNLIIAVGEARLVMLNTTFSF
ncbi:TonB-dependent receptor [Paraburkholderia sp. MPAMCS5]|nr:TonB-dependent receptor [Paraburkholderia sp. MPAMCS5]